MKEIDIHFDYSKVKGSTELHNKFQAEFTVSAYRKFNNIIVIPYYVGFVRAYREPDICFKAGAEGIPDTIVFGDGFYLLLDMKTGKATLQKNQLAYRERFKEINLGKDRVFKINSVYEGLLLIEYEIRCPS